MPINKLCIKTRWYLQHAWATLCSRLRGEHQGPDLEATMRTLLSSSPQHKESAIQLRNSVIPNDLHGTGPYTSMSREVLLEQAPFRRNLHITRNTDV